MSSNIVSPAEGYVLKTKMYRSRNHVMEGTVMYEIGESFKGMGDF